MTVCNKIMLDPGHNGMTDPGAVYEGRRESGDVRTLQWPLEIFYPRAVTM